MQRLPGNLAQLPGVEGWVAAGPETNFTRLPDSSVAVPSQPHPKQRGCTSRVLVNRSFDAYFQLWYLQKFLAIWIHLVWSLGIPRCSCAPTFKRRLKKRVQSAAKHITGSGFDPQNGFWMHTCLVCGWTSCHLLSHLLLWRVNITTKLSPEVLLEWLLFEES